MNASHQTAPQESLTQRLDSILTFGGGPFSPVLCTEAGDSRSVARMPGSTSIDLHQMRSVRSYRPLVITELLAAVLNQCDRSTLWTARCVSLFWLQVIDKHTYLGSEAFYCFNKTDIRHFLRVLTLSPTCQLRVQLARLPPVTSSLLLHFTQLESHRITRLVIRKISSSLITPVWNLLQNGFPRLVDLLLRGDKGSDISHEVPSSIGLEQLIEAAPMLQRLFIRNIQLRNLSSAYSSSQRVTSINIVMRAHPLPLASDLILWPPNPATGALPPGGIAVHDGWVSSEDHFTEMVALWTACIEDPVHLQTNKATNSYQGLFQDRPAWSRHMLVQRIPPSTLRTILAYTNLVLLSITNLAWPFGPSGLPDLYMFNLRILHWLVASVDSAPTGDCLHVNFMEGTPGRGRPARLICPLLKHASIQAYRPDVSAGREDWYWRDWVSCETDNVEDFYTSNLIGPQRLIIDVLGTDFHLNGRATSDWLYFRSLPEMGTLMDWVDNLDTAPVPFSTPNSPGEP